MSIALFRVPNAESNISSAARRGDCLLSSLYCLYIASVSVAYNLVHITYSSLSAAFAGVLLTLAFLVLTRAFFPIAVIW